MTPAQLTKARKLADNLMATCQPSEYWDEVDALTLEESRVLDSIVFECQTCNHWFAVAERHESHGQFYCGDCV